MVKSCLEKNSGPEAGEKPEDADAFFVLDIRYSTGRDVEHDLVAAHKWFNLAAVNGVERAQQCRAEIAEEMTAREIAEAQKAARAWLGGMERRAA